MITTSKVTGLIPNFNRTIQLRESLQAQLFQDFDVILVDDGSTNDFRPFIPERIANRIRIIELPGRNGAAKARNVGIEDSKSPLIAFLDSDDIWHTEASAAQQEAAGEIRVEIRYLSMAERSFQIHYAESSRISTAIFSKICTWLFCRLPFEISGRTSKYFSLIRTPG